jgi:hypothetical protein
MNDKLFTYPFIDKTELKEVIKEAIREIKEEDNKNSRIHPLEKEYPFINLATGGSLLGLCFGTLLGFRVKYGVFDLWQVTTLTLFIIWLIIMAIIIISPKSDIQLPVAKVE